MSIMFDQIAVGIISGWVANQIDVSPKFTLSQVMKHFDRAKQEGKLPADHHLKRAVTKASIDASKVVIQRLIDQDEADFLGDSEQAVLLNGEKLPRNPHINQDAIAINARSALQKKLHELSRALEYHNAEKEAGKTKGKFEQALMEAQLGFSESGLEHFAGQFIGAQNPEHLSDIQTNPTDEVVDSYRPMIAELEKAVTEQLLSFGQWSAPRQQSVKQGLQKALFSPDHAWVNCFALNYIAELQKDPKLYQMVTFLRLVRLDDAIDLLDAGQAELSKQLSDLARQIENQQRDLIKQIADISQRAEISSQLAQRVLDDTRKQFAFNERLVFYNPSMGTQESVRTAIKPFYFAEEEDPFTGRESILKQLHADLLKLDPNVPSFRWAAICGDAGTGKSRLAFQIRKTYEYAWRLSGFVRSEFIKNDSLTPTNLTNITGPTLFLIDYAGSAPKNCYNFIVRCAQLADSAPYPVRVIVLLRRPNDRFFDLVNAREEDALAFNTQARCPHSDEFNHDSGAFLLSKLSEEETHGLMLKRIMRSAENDAARAEVAKDPRNGRSELLSRLKYYDDQMRPLFALMVADAFQRGTISDQSQDISQEEARLSLFWDYLEHEFEKRWSKSLAKNSELDELDRLRIDRHITFLALSTMCRGLTDQGWERLVKHLVLSEAAKSILPHSPLIFEQGYGGAADLLDREHLLSVLTGAFSDESDTGLPYAILEPDLIGEALVLMMLSPRGKKICLNASTCQRRVKYIREFAWVADAEGTAFFSTLCSQDYPVTSAKFDWLMPVTPMTDDLSEAYLKLFRNLSLSVIDPFRYRAPQLADIERMDKLITKFDSIYWRTNQQKTEALEVVSDLSEHLSFVINKSIPPKSLHFMHTVLDKLGKRRLVFGRAAAHAGGEKEEQDDNIDFESLYYLRCDKTTIDAAQLLIKRLYDHALEHVFEQSEIELAYHYMMLIRFACSSVFWHEKDNEASHGFAYSPLSAAEKKELERLAMVCEEIVQREDADEKTISIASGLIYSVIYAEVGKNKLRGEAAFAALENAVVQGRFSDETAISLAMRFLYNHAVNKCNEELEKTEENRKDLSDILALADRLLDTSDAMSALSDSKGKMIVDRYIDVVNQLCGYYEKRNKPTSDLISNGLLKYRNFVKRFSQISINDTIVDAISFAFSACSNENLDCSDTMNSYINFVEESRFDRLALTKKSWDNWRYHFWQLIHLPKVYACQVLQLVLKMQSQVGLRVSRDMGDVLRDHLPDPAVDSSLSAKLVDACIVAQGVDLSPANRLTLNGAQIAQELMYGDDQQIFEKMEHGWTLATRVSDFVDRAEVFQQLQMAILWHGVDHELILPWRKRLLNFLDLTPPAVTELTADIKEIHDGYAFMTAQTFANLEFAKGLNIDDWLIYNEGERA